MSDTTRESTGVSAGGALARLELATTEDQTTRKHIRGSGLLLVGRMISLGLNLATQVVTARYLTKDDFGSFAYALATIALGASIVSLGLDKSAKRFVAIYHEKRDFARLFGTILLSVGTMLAIGLVLVLAVIGLQSVLVTGVIGDSVSVSLLVILIALAPVEALNRLCDGLATAFAGAARDFCPTPRSGTCAAIGRRALSRCRPRQRLFLGNWLPSHRRSGHFVVFRLPHQSP